MKICLHTNWEVSKNFIGGTERFLVDFSKELIALGYEPFIVCSSREKETYVEGIKVIGRFIEDNIKESQRYPFFSSSFIKNEIIGAEVTVDSLKRLSKYTERQLEDIDADIFHLNSFISASFLTPKTKYIVTNHENDNEYDWYWGNGFSDFFQKLVRERKTNLHKFKHLYTPSQHYASYFSHKLNLNINALNLGVSLLNFLIEEKDNSLKQELFFEKEDIMILFPSRFQPYQKGHDIAIKACSLLKEKGIKFKIVFTGVKKSSEKYKSNFDRLVLEYGLQKNVKVITFPNIQEAYRNADIVVSSERFCSYGLSISESLAQGIPTVLSDIPTYREIAKGFKHAFFFKAESEIDLADKLEQVVRIIERNRNEAIRFRLKYDLRKCSYAYSEVYQDAMNG